MVLTMVHNSQNYWVFGPCPSSGILETKKDNVSETGSVLSSGEGGKTPTLLGPLERANHNHCTLSKGPNLVGVLPPSPEDGNRSSFRNVAFSSF
jgi:hypothetical protein